MNKSLNVTVMIDEGTIIEEDPQFTEEPQKITEGHVVGTLRELGHKVSILGVGKVVETIIAELSTNPPDLVFNLTEQFRDNRRLDSNVAGLLELMGIKFTGAGSAGLMLCRDKGLCKQLLALHKIRVPGFLIMPPEKRIRIPKTLRFPVIVKPSYEDGSDGISNASIVRNGDELNDRARFVHERWHQVAIAEEYIDGRELYIGIIGNHRLTVLAPRGITFGGDPAAGAPVIATSRVKWDEEYRDKWQVEYGPAKLSDDLQRRISRVCKKVYHLLQIHDYGRIDIRVNEDEKIIILEANPNPDIAYGEDVSEAAGAIGIGYTALIDRIVKYALRRYRK